MRIGNIEYRETSYFNDHYKKYEEIVLWVKNQHFQNEDELRKDGWSFDEEGNAHKDNFHISASVFKMEFVCHQIAEIIWDKNHDEFNVKSCGLRAFELDEENYRDFKQILKLIETYN